MRRKGTGLVSLLKITGRHVHSGGPRISHCMQDKNVLMSVGVFLDADSAHHLQ